MDKCLIKVDEAFIKSFINIQKNVNRMYGGGLDPAAFDILGETADDHYPGTVSNADIDKLNTALQDIFPNGLNGMLDYYSLKNAGIKISDEVNAYAARKEQPHPLSEIDFSPVFIKEFMNSCYLKDFICAVYRIIQKLPGKKEDNSPLSGFFSAEELKDEINGHIHNDSAFGGFSGWSCKKKSQYLKSWRTLCFLCACFMHLYLKENISLSEWLLIIRWADIIMYVVTNFTEKEKI